MTLARNAYYLAGRGMASVAARVEMGASIFDAEWDICIVLDSARLDMLRQLAPEILGADAVDGRWSLGSCTTEWLASTFRASRRDAIVNTTLVTAHPHTATVFDGREWLMTPGKSPVPYPDPPVVKAGAFKAVHRLYEHATGPSGVVTPETMHEATVAAHRRHDGRVVAHWLQPHEPFIEPAAPLTGGAALTGNVWEGLAAGNLDPGRVWESYLANCQYALRQVARLSQHVNATLLVTADHGNLWGVAGQYGHPFGMPHPQVRRVPWLTVQATRTRTPDIQAGVLEGEAKPAATDQLAALGYR